MDELDYRDIRPGLLTGHIVQTQVHGVVEPLGVLVRGEDIGVHATFRDPLIMTRDRRVAPLPDYVRGLNLDEIEVCEPIGGSSSTDTADLAARLIVDGSVNSMIPGPIMDMISAYADHVTVEPDVWIPPSPVPGVQPICVKMRCKAHSIPEICPRCP